MVHVVSLRSYKQKCSHFWWVFEYVAGGGGFLIGGVRRKNCEREKSCPCSPRLLQDKINKKIKYILSIKR